MVTSVVTPSRELDWIENIENQFRDRPIPNFLATHGHSRGSMSYLLNDTSLFVGDAIPVVTDLPIFVNYEESVLTIQRLCGMKNVKFFCPAWDSVYDSEKFKSMSEASLQMLQSLKNAAMEVAEKCTAFSLNSADRVRLILEKAGLLQFAGNPLVAKSIDACLER